MLAALMFFLPMSAYFPCFDEVISNHGKKRQTEKSFVTIANQITTDDNDENEKKRQKKVS